MKDLIEELRDVFVAAWKRTASDIEADLADAERDGIRAILSALASKGVDVLPNIDEVRAWIIERGGLYSTETREGASMMRAAAAPIFAAKDAERDALRARVAELETLGRAMVEAYEVDRAHQGVETLASADRACVALSDALGPKSDEGKV